MNDRALQIMILQTQLLLNQIIIDINIYIEIYSKIIKNDNFLVDNFINKKRMTVKMWKHQVFNAVRRHLWFLQSH